MVNRQAAPLDRIFAALADPTRRALVARLGRGEATITDLAAPFPISLPALTKHLGVLERAGLLTRRKRGRATWCRLEPAPLRDAAAWLAHYEAFWDTQFDALERFIDEDEARGAEAREDREGAAASVPSPPRPPNPGG